MKRSLAHMSVVACLLLFLMISEAAAQGSLQLPVSGTAASGGSFSGTVALSRFETRGNQIVAIGFLSGTVSHKSRTLGTALVGEVLIPVTVRAGGVSTVKAPAPTQPQLRRVVFSTATTAPNTRLVQAEPCPVVDMVLGPFTVNVLGVDVAIQPIDVQLEGQRGTPLGDLVCQVNELIGNVAGLVGVVNGILNLLIGLLGGLGGAIPGA
jgi:hypothetical protein